MHRPIGLFAANDASASLLVSVPQSITIAQLGLYGREAARARSTILRGGSI